MWKRLLLGASLAALTVGVGGCSSENSTGLDAGLVPPNALAGTYTCSGCSASHAWYIDAKHTLHWDGVPYIPYAGFAAAPGNPWGITEFDPWIDTDTTNPHGDPVQLATFTSDVTSSGGSYLVQMSIRSPPNDDASTLLDPEVRRQLVEAWRPYQSAVSKEGLRGVVLWNEIDVNFTWPESRTSREYAAALAQMAQEAKNLFGDVPVSFKTTSPVVSRPRVLDILAGAAGSLSAGGLGFDIFPPSCSPEAFSSLSSMRAALEDEQEKTSWLWVAEMGRGLASDPPAGTCYWDAFPPFQTKADMQCYLEALADRGAKGFVFNGPPGAPCDESYQQNYVWYGELKSQIVQRALAAP